MARRWPRQSRGPPEKGMNVGAGLAAPASRAAPAAVHLGAAVSRTSACMVQFHWQDDLMSVYELLCACMDVMLGTDSDD